ncbi:MAG: SPFH domain-containing protein [Cryobacterium sp.]|nr:SPFH domain-containing protein [Oligoflexia bacterium]
MTYLYGVLGAIVIIGLIALSRSYFRVEEGHAAILSIFGKIHRRNGEMAVYSAGMHRKFPWEWVHEFSVMERVLGIREDSRELEVLVRDGTLLRMNPQVRFQFEAKQAELFVFGISKPIHHLREMFRSLIGNEIASFGKKDSEEGSYADIRRNRGELNEALRREFQGDVGNRYGIRFRAIDIAEILPPADLAQALNSVQRVEAEYDTLLKRIQAECEQKISGAEHGVEIAGMHAEAQEIEIGVLGGAIAQLEKEGTLDAYVSRRADEAASLSRTLFMKN